MILLPSIDQPNLVLEQPSKKTILRHLVLPLFHLSCQKVKYTFVAERYSDFYLTQAPMSARSSRHPWWVQLYFYFFIFFLLSICELDWCMAICMHVWMSESSVEVTVWLESFKWILVYMYFTERSCHSLYLCFFCPFRENICLLFLISFVSVYAQTYML